MTSGKERGDGERLYLFVQHLARRLRDIDAAAGISPARFSALVNLAFHGVNNVGELAAMERVSRPAMTRLVQDMEEAGLVERLVDESDGRGVMVRLTPKGRGIVDRVRRAKIAFVETHLDSLDQGARVIVRGALDALKGLED